MDADFGEDELDVFEPLAEDGRLILSASSLNTFFRCGVQQP